MALSMKQVSLTLAFMGTVAFILGIIAENKKAASGIPIVMKGIVVCKYLSELTIILGYIAIASSAAAAFFGVCSIFYPYEGKSVPSNALFKNAALKVFLCITGFLSLLAIGMLTWATVTEHMHMVHNIHHDMDTKCPTAKTGLFGGAAFMALNASLFWLICLMLTANCREDFLDEEEEDKENLKGGYGQVTTGCV